jgi:hypothetical protein
MEGPLRERAGMLHQELSRPQALAVIWCIENLVPALQAATNRYQIVFYEELLERPEEEWQRVAEGLGLAVVPGRSLLQQPSQQSAVRLQKQEMADDNYSETYGSWRKRLSTTDTHQIAQVLDSFGVEFYTVSENRPNPKSFTRKFLAK